MIIAVDFDGVLHDWKHPLPGFHMGPPMANAQQSMLTLKKNGARLIIFTVRAAPGNDVSYIQRWLEYWQVPHDSITAIKPQADVYLDDKALRFTTWDFAINQLKDLWIHDGLTI